MKIINIENWKRKEYFEFFRKYDNPFFGIVTEIDCTRAYEKSKENGLSFFAYYLHKSIMAVNRVQELKFRIVNGKVAIFDAIHAAATIGRADGTFGFSFMNFSSEFDVFNAELKEEIQKVQNTQGLRANDDGIRLDVVHYSIFPWAKFTSLTHPRNFNTDDSVPKIAFGKIFMAGDRKMLPISVEAHHGLADGLHIAKFLKEFENLMNE